MAEEFPERYKLMVEAARGAQGPKRVSVEFYESLLPKRILNNLEIESRGDSRFSDGEYIQNLMRLYDENVVEICSNANLMSPIRRR